MIITLHIYFLDYHDAVFVVGALDETLILRGMRYHPIDWLEGSSKGGLVAKGFV